MPPQPHEKGSLLLETVSEQGSSMGDYSPHKKGACCIFVSFLIFEKVWDYILFLRIIVIKLLIFFLNKKTILLKIIKICNIFLIFNTFIIF